MREFKEKIMNFQKSERIKE